MTIEERFEFLTQSIQSHDRQLGELTDKMAATERNIHELTGVMNKLTGVMNNLAGVMNNLAGVVTTLAETVTTHERRISGLEGKA
jgi:prophage DNA circulation protein